MTTQLDELLVALIVERENERQADTSDTPLSAVITLCSRAVVALQGGHNARASDLMNQAAYVVVDQWDLTSDLGERVVAYAHALRHG